MTKRVLLLSIQPPHAEKIFEGTKLVELRRTRPRIAEGDLILVYVSSPVKAIVGIIEIDKIIDATPARLWPEVSGLAGINRKQFDEYYRGAERAFGLFLKNVRWFPHPIDLQCLRRLWHDFRPPQSFRYLSWLDFGHLVEASKMLRKRQMFSMIP
jgi:predicted transcriptional regulator